MIELEIISQNWKEKKTLTLGDYIKNGGFLALKKTLRLSKKKIIKKIKASGLRGRSGSGFPVGIKWEAVAKEASKNNPTFLIANAHEGEPFTFKDWQILKKNPYLVLEGMLIAGYTVEAQKGIIFLNERYLDIEKKLFGVLKELKENSFLGKNILKKGFDFEIEVEKSLPFYICGEERTLVNVLEGKRPEPRPKPPYIYKSGLFSKPTLVNNVETLANIPFIIREGEDWFSSLGSSSCSGTKLISLDGNVLYPGIYEIAMGTSLKNIIYKIGGGVLGSCFFALVGGYGCGQVVLPQYFDISLDFDSGKKGASIGTGTIFVYNNGHHLFDILEKLSRFFKNESCGRCAPCREGTFFIHELLKNKKKLSLNEYEEILKIIEILKQTAFCGFSKMPSLSLGSILRAFKEKIVL